MDETKMTPKQIWEYNVFALMMYQAMIVNDRAVMMMYDLIHALEQRPDIYKGAVKYRANILHKQIRQYNALNDKRMGHNDTFLADLFDAFEEVTASDSLKLEYTIKNFLHRQREPEVDLLTKIVLADTWGKGMIHNIEMTQKKMAGRVKAIYLEAMDKVKFPNLRNALIQLTDVIHIEKDPKGPIVELAGDRGIYQGFMIILNKLSNPERIIEMCQKYGGKEVIKERC